MNLKNEIANITKEFYPEVKMTPEQDYEERLNRLRELSLKDLDEMIDNNIDKFEADKLKEDYIQFILEYDLDIKDGFYELP